MGQKKVIQSHHIIYRNDEHKQKDVTANIYKGEHWLLCQLHRRSNISRGFIKDVKVWLALNEDRAIDL